MLRISIYTTVIALSGCASEWRAMPIDGSSQSTAAESIALIEVELSALERDRLFLLLEDLWISGLLDAEARGAAYGVGDFLARLDGLRYKQVLDLAGPDTTPRYWGQVAGENRRRSINPYDQNSPTSTIADEQAIRLQHFQTQISRLGNVEPPPVVEPPSFVPCMGASCYQDSVNRR